MSRLDWELNEAERATQIDQYQKAIAKHVRENERLEAKLKAAEEALLEFHIHRSEDGVTWIRIGCAMLHLHKLGGPIIQANIVDAIEKARAALEELRRP